MKILTSTLGLKVIMAVTGFILIGFVVVHMLGTPCNLNPIIKDYMKEKKIRMVVDKKSLLLADENLNITKDIMSLLNKKLKSIKLN